MNPQHHPVTGLLGQRQKLPEGQLCCGSLSLKVLESSRLLVALCDCVDHSKLKILKKVGIPDHLTCLLRNLYAGQEATVRTGHEQQTGSKSGKEYIKAVYCHPAYLTSMQSTS